MSKRPRERSSELLDVRILDSGKVAPITNDITTFLAPLSLEEFQQTIYRKKALVIKAAPKFRDQRLEHIREVLNQFNPVKMLEESNSEQINVWMGSGDTLHSVKVQPKEAKGCYDAGCGLYFRASEELETEFVSGFSEALGHSFASYFRDGQRRGEIETFATHIGHVTNWHTDFQENFTVQLRGAKRWYLYKSPVEHPHRAFAPHFRNTAVLHTQLQTARAANSSFNGIPEDIDENCESIVLQPGDVLYHPAGIFHKVETIGVTDDDHTNSLSINISLFPQSWGQFIAESTYQMSIAAPELRERVRFDSLEDAHKQIAARLAYLQQAISQLKPSMLMPAAMLAPIGLVRVTPKGIEREDGVVVKVAEEATLAGPWRRNPLGVLSRTPQELEVPLRQRPAQDHDEESESDDDNGEVEVPEGFTRFDYHANYVAGEANPDVTPAIHCVLLVHSELTAVMDRLARIAQSGEVPKPTKKLPTGLIRLLLDLGFMA